MFGVEFTAVGVLSGWFPLCPVRMAPPVLRSFISVVFDPDAWRTPPFSCPPVSFVKALFSCACPVPNISLYLGGSLGRLSYGGGWNAFGLAGLKSPMSGGLLMRFGETVEIGMSEPATVERVVIR